MDAAKSQHSRDTERRNTHVGLGANDRSHDIRPVYTALLHYITVTVLSTRRCKTLLRRSLFHHGYDRRC